MKEQYIKRVKKELHLSRKIKKEIVRDLEEIFSSALEHGETEQQVIDRLGAPQIFAKSAAEQFGMDAAVAHKRKERIADVMALLVAVISFAIYAFAKIDSVPEGTIGQADAMTNIRIEGAFAGNVAHMTLLVGVVALAFVAVQMFRSIRQNRRKV